MSETGHQAGSVKPASPSAAIRIPRDLDLSAASRLVSDAAGPRNQAAKRLVASAGLHGIDLSLMWGTVNRAPDGRPTKVRQVCLAIPGAGRTAMLMISGPQEPGAAPAARQQEERVLAIEEACRFLAGGRTNGRGPEVCLAQALPEPNEPWAVEAFVGAGFTRLGELAYMRRRLPGEPLDDVTEWPAGITVRNVRSVGTGEPERALLIRALERTYEDTLDCPGLCGLRETTDVLESHRATGEWDGSRWWLVFDGDEPHGCVLLSHCPEQRSVELVYLGLSKRLRGKGLSRRLLSMAIARLGDIDADHVACAVDTRNAPAIRLYESLGFATATSRVALVRAL